MPLQLRERHFNDKYMKLALFFIYKALYLLWGRSLKDAKNSAKSISFS